MYQYIGKISGGRRVVRHYSLGWSPGGCGSELRRTNGVRGSLGGVMCVCMC